MCKGRGRRETPPQAIETCSKTGGGGADPRPKSHHALCDWCDMESKLYILVARITYGSGRVHAPLSSREENKEGGGNKREGESKEDGDWGQRYTNNIANFRDCTSKTGNKAKQITKQAKAARLHPPKMSSRSHRLTATHRQQTSVQIFARRSMFKRSAMIKQTENDPMITTAAQEVWSHHMRVPYSLKG